MDFARTPVDADLDRSQNDRITRLSDRIWVWGIPFSPVSFHECIAAINELLLAREPTYVVTANLHYTMLCHHDVRLRRHAENAALVLADGMPIIWASRWRERQLPERVAGADLLPALCGVAAVRGHRVFFLGGKPGVAERAAAALTSQNPGLNIVGIANPLIQSLSSVDHDRLIEQIRSTNPDILFVALGQPKGEFWVGENFRRIGATVTIQVGASIDFAAGLVRRAPAWMQRVGLEWLFRLGQEPVRLIRRYTSNAWFATCRILQDLFTRRCDRR